MEKGRDLIWNPGILEPAIPLFVEAGHSASALIDVIA